MDRRTLLRFVAVAGGSLGGCVADRGPTPTPRRSPGRVTTTGGDDVALVASEVVIRSDAPGPEAVYRLRNTGETDATTGVRTVLRFEGADGGEYAAAAVVDVPAGDDVTLRYLIVRTDALSDADRARLDRGAFDVVVFVDGRERRGA